MANLKTTRSIRRRYILGLGVFALLLTASFFTMQRVDSEQRHFSNLVNLAGHQSGLANRITYFSSLMATATGEAEFLEARRQIDRAISRMQADHDVLRKGAREQVIPLVEHEKLNALYEDPKDGLDLSINRFLERAKAIRDNEFGLLDSESTEYLYVTVSGPQFLEPMLDTLADEYQKSGNEAFSRIETIELVLWLVALFVLVLLIILLFYPMERQVGETVKTLESSVDDLTAHRERLQFAQRLGSIGDWHLDITEGVLTWSEQLYQICGVSPDSYEVTVAGSRKLIHPEDRPAVFKAIQDIRKARRQSSNLEYRIIRPDGNERLVYQRVVIQQHGSGKTDVLAGIIHDITERKDLSNRLEKLSENIPGFMYEFQLDPDGVLSIPYASLGIMDTLGVTPEQVRLDPRTALHLFHSDDLGRLNITIFESAEKQEQWQDQFRVKHPWKGELWVEAHATPQKLSDGSTHWYGYIWDITNRKRSEDQIRHLALYDPLTGLANRRLLEDRLRHAIATSGRNRSYGAVLMLDLDHFKTLNDTKGHNVGDELLREVANRLKQCVRETDTIARLGGDEFVVILELLGTVRKGGRKQSMNVAEKIRTTLNQTYYLSNDEHIHHASASIGVAIFQGNEKNYGELLKRADVAMFEAKDLGRNRVCFFTEQRQAIINSRTAMAHDMQRALENGEFSMYYQPQVSNSGTMCGAEALLRWQPPGREKIQPSTFIPIAEDTGLIIPLGEWVFRTVCRHIKNFSFYNLPPGFAVAVNISARQFADDDFLQKVTSILHRTGVDIDRVKLELTESCLIHDLERGQENLTKLREMGLHIELDDFGTGYSSLNSLKNLPLDTIKIDSSLVHGIEGDVRDAAIVRAAIAMGKALDLNVIAEGVETPEHNDFLVKEGCDMLQGFLHAKPLPYRAFLAYLQAQQKKAEELHSGSDREQSNAA